MRRIALGIALGMFGLLVPTLAMAADGLNGLVYTDEVYLEPEVQEPTFWVGLEVPLLFLNSNHGNHQPEDCCGNTWLDEGIDPQVAFRALGGFDLANGFGGQGDFFWYNQTNEDADDIFFRAVLAGAEGTVDVDVENWHIVASAGARYGHIEWPDEDGSDGYYFDGVGFTLGLDGRVQVTDALAVVGGAQLTQLYGTTTEIEFPDDTAPGTLIPITELYAGVEYTHTLHDGVTVVVGLKYESTLFSSMSGNVDSDIDPEDIDVTLSGPSVSATLIF